MKKHLISYTLFLISFSLSGHPGIGIVKDSKGNIYYTDLKQVWKISTDGVKTPVVTGVHTHELYIDGQDNLYGEHLWYNGESKNTWGHYVWCLRNNGQLVREIDPTEGFLTNYSFIRDSSGNMYWVERFTTSRIMKKSKTGEITKLVEGKFGFIGWMFSTKNGTLYFTENNKLHRLSTDRESGNYRIEMLAENIGSRSTDFSVMGRNYDSYGIWADGHDNIYIAMIDSKKVIRIGPDGKSQEVISSTGAWTICSGIFDNAGNMWVLENSIGNEVRARKISNEELLAVSASHNTTTRTHVLITIFTAVIIVILFSFAKMFLTKRKKGHINFAI